MSIKRIEVLERFKFIPIYGETGAKPSAPEVAIEVHEGLQAGWLRCFPRTSRTQPLLNFFTVKSEDGNTQFVIEKTLLIFR